MKKYKAVQRFVHLEKGSYGEKAFIVEAGKLVSGINDKDIAHYIELGYLVEETEESAKEVAKVASKSKGKPIKDRLEE